MTQQTQYPPRILLAKIGLDGHDRGVKMLARAFRDAGMEVIYTGLWQTCESTMYAAMQEDVDVVGVSLLSAAHMTVMPELVRIRREIGCEHIPLVLGGIVPETDYAALHDDASRALYADVIARTRREFGADHIDLAESLQARAQLDLLQGRWAEADEALREAEAIHRRAGSERSPRALIARSDRSRVLIAGQRWQDAIAVLEQVRALRSDGAATEASWLAGESVQLAYARCRARAKPDASDVAAMESALVALRRDPPLPRARVAEAASWVADCRRHFEATTSGATK